MNNIKGNTFTVKNVKLFSEYERQIKRKITVIERERICHGLVETDEEIFPEMYMQFDFIYNGGRYYFKLHAPNEPVNGDIECELYLHIHKTDEWHCMKYKESRKPMEMNVDNLVNTARMMIEMYEGAK